MIDQRLIKLCKTVVEYSINVQKGEKVLIENFDCPDELSTQLIKQVYSAGGIPYHISRSARITRALLKNATKEQIEDMARYDSLRMKDMDAYVNFSNINNMSVQNDLNEEQLNLYQSIYAKQVHRNIRAANTKWVSLHYPNASMAQLAGVSTEQFEDFYFDVCNMDYSKMDEAMTVFQTRTKSVDKVRIVAKDTDITFSIKGIPIEKCSGHMNVPGGEIFTAPVRNSANGYITYNTSSMLYGFKFENIRLEFKHGKIIKATANDTDRINKILDTDEGARYLGEFAFGVNPYIKNQMGVLLFDEKIAGSIHLTPGACYKEADNGNTSAIHWDLVQIHRDEYGGGEIFFDDKLIRKNGVFLGKLDVLNEENLK